MIFRSRAPLRISFAGGGTDVPPYPEESGGLVLNATINRYAYGSLEPRGDGKISIHSIDLGEKEELDVGESFELDGKLGLARAAIKEFVGSEGFDLVLQSNAPPGSGLGASSSLMVALIGVLCEFGAKGLTDYETANMAHRLEREDLGIGGGRQDQFAATFGGFNFIEFEGDKTLVNPLRVSPATMLELEYNLLLVFTGISRQSDHIIEDQTSRLQQEEAATVSGLEEQKQLAVEMKETILRGNLDGFASLLDSAWESKKKLSNRISNPRIEELYAEAKNAGATGGKVTGAGGGGYMLLYCGNHSKERVMRRMIELDAVPELFAFEPDGLVTWRANG